MSSARILIVDDEVSIREMLYRVLSRAGYNTAVAANAREALEELAKDPFDIVLLDVNMPGRSGMDLLPTLSVEYPDTAVFVLTGGADVATGVRALREGAYDYATKPVDFAELVMRVEQALARMALQIERRTYQGRLERIVDELNARQEECTREIEALRLLLRAQSGQGEAASRAYAQLRESLDTFSHELDGLTTIVGVWPTPVLGSYDEHPEATGG